MSQARADRGGAPFEAVGLDLTQLVRSRNVVRADVLDTWFDLPPGGLETLRRHLAFLVKSPPPSHAEGFVEDLARRRGVPVESVPAGAGSSSLLFACLRRMPVRGRPIVVLDPR
ncbi:MAG: hypothetical protein ACUVS7_00585 [Bryobacteraceae bacterium]